MRNRIRELRQYLKLSQETFGERINVSKPSISAYERGEREPTERVIADICRVYSISETWLRTGEGHMHSDGNDFIFTEISSKYGLSPLEESMVKNFLTLSPENRKGVLAYVQKMVASVLENYNAYASEIPLAQNNMSDAELYDYLDRQKEETPKNEKKEAQ